jgi:hypothetical protein
MNYMFGTAPVVPLHGPRCKPPKYYDDVSSRGRCVTIISFASYGNCAGRDMESNFSESTLKVQQSAASSETLKVTGLRNHQVSNVTKTT